jgi:hypothetical protein
MKSPAHRPLPRVRQPQLTFTREGPRLPRTAMDECQVLLTQLLVEVIREESTPETRRSHE